MNRKLLLGMLITIIYGCSSPKDEIPRLLEDLFVDIGCPKVQPMFGSFAFCAKSYNVDKENNVFILNMIWSPEMEMTLPLDKWRETKKLETYMTDIVCDAVSQALGVNGEAILGKSAGIIQSVVPVNWDYDKHVKVSNEMAMRTRVNIELVVSNTTYLITRWAYTESNKVPQLCTIRKTGVRV